LVQKRDILSLRQRDAHIVWRRLPTSILIEIDERYSAIPKSLNNTLGAIIAAIPNYY
jgi:hypothetical protein